MTKTVENMHVGKRGTAGPVTSGCVIPPRNIGHASAQVVLRDHSRSGVRAAASYHTLYQYAHHTHLPTHAPIPEMAPTDALTTVQIDNVPPLCRVELSTMLRHHVHALSSVGGKINAAKIGVHLGNDGLACRAFLNYATMASAARAQEMLDKTVVAGRTIDCMLKRAANPDAMKEVLASQPYPKTQFKPNAPSKPKRVLVHAADADGFCHQAWVLASPQNARAPRESKATVGGAASPKRVSFAQLPDLRTVDSIEAALLATVMQLPDVADDNGRAPGPAKEDEEEPAPGPPCPEGRTRLGVSSVSVMEALLRKATSMPHFVWDDVPLAYNMLCNTTDTSFMAPVYAAPHYSDS